MISLPKRHPVVQQRNTATMAPEPGSTERHQACRPAHPSPSDLAADSCRPGVNKSRLPDDIRSRHRPPYQRL